MSYRIEWRPEVMSRLDAEWDLLPWPEKKRVEDRLDEIDLMLGTEPLGWGESRGVSTDRVLLHGPIHLFYRVQPQLGLVVIIGARMVANP